MDNLYIHFPFCRNKCSYCALYSRAGSSALEREEYVKSLVPLAKGEYKTVYFGGGSPGICKLDPLLEVISANEWTVELHPLDVSDELLSTFKAGGVNRISMGVQSLDDNILKDMRRGYTVAQAEKAFFKIREYFDNVGIDIIIGYPGEREILTNQYDRLKEWGLRHCSVYALQNERGLKNVVNDETVMNRICYMAKFLKEIGLRRYEISNYAIPGYECKHNLSVWRGEDYRGLGMGACGREGLMRTNSGRVERVSVDFDKKERRLFRMRTYEGLDTDGYPEWAQILNDKIELGLVTRDGGIYHLTERGMEVCDSILAELV